MQRIRPSRRLALEFPLHDALYAWCRAKVAGRPI